MSRRGLAGLALVVWLAGCAAPLPAVLDPSLFPRTAAAPTVSVAVVVPSHLADLQVRAEGGFGVPGAPVMPIGRIVEAAVLATLGNPTPAAPGPTLTIDSAGFEFKIRVLWMLPMPYIGMIGDTEAGGRVNFVATLRDAQGRLAWTRPYDTGREVWKLRPGPGEKGGVDLVTRRTHEAAWRLAQQLARDVADWQAGEWLKPREL